MSMLNNVMDIRKDLEDLHDLVSKIKEALDLAYNIDTDEYLCGNVREVDCDRDLLSDIDHLESDLFFYLREEE